MPLTPDTALLHYRLTDKLGEGGMGVVWKGVDTSLDREVAIKVLPEALAQDTERLARFEREARTLASLNHPGIAAVHGLHQADTPDGSVRFIAMEYIAGEDLSDRVQRGPIPVDDALNIARQIAEALEVAHENNVVHRDLKPANVMIKADGTAKVLDFGLAKAFQPDANSRDSASLSMSPTMTSGGTQMGVILGTASYMSPEQAKGMPVDRRADIWAFGIVLAELLTGRKMFDADTVSEVMAQVLMGPIELDALPAKTPLAVRRLIERCLERDPRRRLRDIGEARVLLEDVVAGKHADDAQTVVQGAGAALPAQKSFLATAWPFLTAIAGMLAVVAIVWLAVSSKEPDRPLVVTSVVPPAESEFSLRLGMTLSPDGTRLVFAARDADGTLRLWLRELSDATPRALAGTEGGAQPFWAPDGRQLAFSTVGALKKIDVDSGVVETLAQTTARGGTWGTGGTIVFQVRDGLMRVPETGGTPEVLVTTHEQTWPQTPAFLPDGEHVLYLGRRYGAQESGQIRVTSLDGQVNRPLIEANSSPLYAEGHLLWWHDGNLRAQRLDTETLELTGDSRVVISDVRQDRNSGRMLVSVARNDTLAYHTGATRQPDELVWVDREGNTLEVLGPPGAYYGPRLSPDGQRILFDISDETNRGDIWMLDARGARTRLTSNPEDETRPRWSPDGRRFAFSSSYNTESGAIWIGDARAGTQPRKLVEKEGAELHTVDWATDDLIIIEDQGEFETYDLLTYSISSDTLEPWQATRFGEYAATTLPGTRFAAFTSNETGRLEVYVQALRGASERWRVSVDGGLWPDWRGDGGELYFRAPDGRLMAVPVDWSDRNAPTFGRPAPLFFYEGKTHSDRQYDTLDGQRFLINRHSREGANDPITLVQNWKQLLD